MPKTGVLSTSPYDGEGDIALTREFVVRFSMPLKEGSVISEDMFMAHSAGELMVTAPRLSSDRMKATLFLNGFRWPSNSKVPFPSLAINSMTFLVAKSMWMEMNPGGTAQWTFSTLAVEPSDENTTVSGYVYDSDNSNGDIPLEGVIISVVGNEEQFTTTTGADGKFTFPVPPSGAFRGCGWTASGSRSK